MTMHMSTAGFGESIAAHLSAVDRAVTGVVNVTVVDIQRVAKRECPRDSGDLSRSIGTYFAGDSPLPKHVGAVVAEMPYAAYVEDGTSKARAQPYLNPAVHEVKPKFLTKIAAAMKGVF